VKTLTQWKRIAVAVFYAFSLPLAGLVFLARTQNALSVCSFIILMPVGMVLGLVVLAPRDRVSQQRGFEIQPRQREFEVLPKQGGKAP
jgi:hypothetical protein